MKRNFCLGSEWLYFKIYAGVKTTDLILCEKLQPIITALEAENIISKWFFIRYKDTHEHFRIRFLCHNPQNIAVVISRLYPLWDSLLETDLIWKVQTDTYQREIERYGTHTIEDAETLFWQDSKLVLQYLNWKPTFEKKEIQLLYSFLVINSLLDSFQLTVVQKRDLLEQMQKSFKAEFAADKVLKKEMDKSYRALADEIKDFLDGKAKNEFLELYDKVEENRFNIRGSVTNIQKSIQVSLFAFLNSLIHMMVNRQFSSKQRMYECLIYDHLHRYYKKEAYEG
jgi:thiopeptide-type bacteriocin biosynthesis protein